MNWLTLEILFFAACGFLGYTFFGYHLLMACLARFRKPGIMPADGDEAAVSVVVAMGNEETYAVSRVRNLLESTYKNLEIIIVLDQPTDRTEALISQFLAESPELGDRKVAVCPLKNKSGKAACLNHGVGKATGAIIVFCDARQTFSPDAISKLVAHFGNSTVGAVSGELMIEGAEAGDMGAYWRFEKFLRRSESRFSSVIGCTGAIYACRKTLVHPIPHDTILDDVLIPMRCLEQGYAVKFEPEAVAYEPLAATADSESDRKIRTLAGNWQLLFRYPGWLLPWKKTQPTMLVSHKYLRLLGPYLLAVLLVSNIALASYCPVFQGALLGQALFYGLAAVGLLLPATKLKILSLAATFTYLNWLNAAALVYYLKGGYRKGWERGRV